MTTSTFKEVTLRVTFELDLKRGLLKCDELDIDDQAISAWLWCHLFRSLPLIARDDLIEVEFEVSAELERDCSGPGEPYTEADGVRYVYDSGEVRNEDAVHQLGHGSELTDGLIRDWRIDFETKAAEGYWCQ